LIFCSQLKILIFIVSLLDVYIKIISVIFLPKTKIIVNSTIILVMKLSIIIPCFNAADTIGLQLEAFCNQKWSEPWEIIVAENGSTDSALEVIKQYQPRLPNLSVVDASDKKGASHARNMGVKVARSEAIAFCDADDEVTPGWVAAMGEALSQYDFVCGINDHWKLNDPWLVKSYESEDEGRPDYAHPYLPVIGANNLGVKRSLHETIGGFDEKFMSIEDVDYCWRIQNLGIKIQEIPEALLHFRFRPNIMPGCRRHWAFGVYEILIQQKHKEFGMHNLIYWKSCVRTGLVFCLKLLSLRIRDKATLAQELRTLAWRLGQLWGCVKFGYIPS
jgi:glycosyltransferase involved in cell wall biosynthesis